MGVASAIQRCLAGVEKEAAAGFQDPPVLSVAAQTTTAWGLASYWGLVGCWAGAGVDKAHLQPSPSLVEHLCSALPPDSPGRRHGRLP